MVSWEERAVRGQIVEYSVGVLQLLSSRETRVDFVGRSTDANSGCLYLRRVEWKTRRMILDRLHWLGYPGSL